MKKILMLVISAMFVLSACGSGPKIGTLLDETGDLGAYGAPIQMVLTLPLV